MLITMIFCYRRVDVCFKYFFVLWFVYNIRVSGMKSVKKPKTSFIGIDEVGRGALAGPVTVAAVLLSPGARSYFKSKIFEQPLRDSKGLSARGRMWWNQRIREQAKKVNGGVLCVVRSISPRGIEKINISRAANKAATRAIVSLSKKAQRKVRYAQVTLDGGLFLAPYAFRAHVSKDKCKTVVRGDLRFVEVKLASIIAKVYRDRVLKRLHTKYAKYNFDANKGYGTRLHIKALKKHGPSIVHRKTFISHLL